MSTTCSYDSGSMTGCRPLCDAPATTVLEYDGLRALLCASHVKPMRARAYPYECREAPVTDYDRLRARFMGYALAILAARIGGRS